ncbi:PSD1 and planctomycete cytochrome C domain-containing protein [Planctomycetaceae bacterium SH139]
MRQIAVAAILTILLLAPSHVSHASEPPPIDFQRDIWPILTARCNGCHGESAQEGQLRLDAKAIALRGGISGPAIIPGEAQASLLLARISGADDGERMPLDDEPLSDQQIALLRRWIESGANWPDAIGSEAQELEPHWAYIPPMKAAPPAVSQPDWVASPIDAFVLARLDRAGLAPSPPADRATLLRRLSLDLLGIPPTLEQLDAFLADASPDAYERAVDQLLTSPRYGERWARQWLDLARYADSNGYQADQYRTVWPYRDWVIQAMNENMPFDRFTIEQLAGDLLPQPTLQQQIATGFHRLTTCNVEAGVDPEENRVNQVIDRVNTTGYVWLGSTIECSQCHNHKYDPFSQADYYRFFAFFNNTPLEVEGDGVTYNFIGPMLELPLADEQLARREALQAQLSSAKQTLAAAVKIREQGFEAWLAAVSDDGTSPAEHVPAEITKLLEIPQQERTGQQHKQLRKHYLDIEPAIVEARQTVATFQAELDAIKPITSLVMIEQDQPRETRIFLRGNFLTPGKVVEPASPAALHAWPADSPPNRLGLARWLVQPGNPLTPRVVVNRWWAEFFGRGLVATLEDFGSQCEPPTHPQLLDWLARDFVEHGWSMKHVHKRIVMSSTYRQSSRLRRELLAVDPENELLARGPRFRLSAEMIRDNALHASGLLSGKMGGPPVYPPQPDGLWRHVGRNAPKYDTSQGTDRFRRGVYVVWRRSAPYASFTNFDAPDRAACVVQRPRTNTPLQALTLLNDPAYQEMALALAKRIAAYPTATPQEKVEYGFRLCVSRRPQTHEANLLAAVYHRELERLRNDPLAVQKSTEEQNADLAAWLFVANILLNLDETITKE